MKKVLMFAALVLGAGCFAENLLVNGDMQASKGWDIWGSAPKDKAIRAQILTYVNEGPNGARVLKFNDLAQDANPYLHQEVALKSVAPAYTLTFKVKAASGQKFAAGVQIFEKKMEGGKAVYTAVSGRGLQKVFIGTGDWQTYSMKMSKFALNMNTMSVVLYPFPYSQDKTLTGSILVTDVVLEAAE